MDLERDAARTREQIGAIADLLISGPVPQDNTPRLRLAGTRAPVQLVIAATLPGLSRPWVGQYAHHTAQSRGPAALARVHGERVELEIYGDAQAPAPQTEFAETLAIIGPVVSDWLIAIEPDRLLSADAAVFPADRWTVLTGSDEESIVDTYSLLRAALRSGPAPAGGVGVMIMGCDHRQAQQAWGRLRRAAKAHLDIEVAFVGSHQRIEPVKRRRATAPVDGAWGQLNTFLAQTPAEPIEPAPTQATPNLTASETTPEPDADLPLRCPYHPQVGLRVDAEGQLHMDLDDPGAPHEAICRLMAAGAWARDHADWIARAVAPNAMNNAAPALHLWTADPNAAETIAAWWPGPHKPVRIHAGPRQPDAGGNHA